MRVFFTHLGCKLNQAEIERLAGEFVAAGHTLAGSLDAADVHVINSCTVTQAAARDSRKAVARGRRSGAPTRPLTVLTGCYATERAEAAARLEGVDLLVVNADKDHLLEHAHAAFNLAPLAVPSLAAPPFAAPPPLAALGNTRAMLKIEDGCDMSCAFCIIPATRGRQRSRSPSAVVSDALSLAAAGCREIVLTGVQISAWRCAGERLSGLVRRLLDVLPAHGLRLRLTSIAPWELGEELLALWTDPRLCRHLHLSLQSGATATLRRMRRPYTAERFSRLLEQVRAAIPGVAVTTDVIVGFPGEDEAEFEASLRAVAAMELAKVHVFPYSPRPGTAAASAPSAVPAKVMRERMTRMLGVAAAAERNFWRSHLDRRATVLWERPRRGRGHGLTDNYIRVWSDRGAGLVGRLTPADLVALGPHGVEGEPILT